MLVLTGCVKMEWEALKKKNEKYERGCDKCCKSATRARDGSVSPENDRIKICGDILIINDPE